MTQRPRVIAYVTLVAAVHSVTYHPVKYVQAVETMGVVVPIRVVMIAAQPSHAETVSSRGICARCLVADRGGLAHSAIYHRSAIYQKEAIDRLSAGPGGADNSRLAVAALLAAAPMDRVVYSSQAVLQAGSQGTSQASFGGWPAGPQGGGCSPGSGRSSAD